jgi:hypothetical protein
LHAQRAHGGNGLFLAVGDHADEVAFGDHLHVAGQVGHGVAVHGHQAAADEVAAVAARMRRADHAAMAHARHAHIVDKAEFARGLGGNVHARRAPAHQPVVAGRLELYLLLGGARVSCSCWPRSSSP